MFISYVASLAYFMHFFFFFFFFCERARVRVINWRAPNVHVSLQFTRSRIDMYLYLFLNLIVSALGLMLKL